MCVLYSTQHNICMYTLFCGINKHVYIYIYINYGVVSYAVIKTVSLSIKRVDYNNKKVVVVV